jgi:RHS repeat-associated protein
VGAEGAESLEFGVLSLRESEPGTPWAVVCGAGEGVDVSIDPNGNMTSDGAKTYTWDAENRLVEVKQGGNTLAAFAYDGVGRRVEKVVGGVTHRYVQEGMHVAEERLSNGATGATRYFLGLGIDEWLGRQNADSSTTYFMADHLGSITTETSSAGAVTLARSYDAWGNLDAASAAVSGPAFTGREWEAEAGLYYYRARNYGPRVGRFISEDPIGFQAGVNFYAYVDNDPVNWTDPLGLESGAEYRWQWCVGTGKCPPPRSWYDTWSDWHQRGSPRVGWRYVHCMASCETVRHSGLAAAKIAGYANEARQTLRCWTFWPGDCASANAPQDYKDNEWGYTCPANITCEKRCEDLSGRNKTPAQYGPYYTGPR